MPFNPSDDLSGGHLEPPHESDDSPTDSGDKAESAGLRSGFEAGFRTPMMFLHPVSLIFDLLAHSRQYLIPVLFGLFGAANGDLTLIIISAVMFVPAVGSSILRYVTFRYRIEDQQLIIEQGLIFRKTRTVPVSRIQNIDLVQNVLHRLFGVAEVKIETASGTEPEAVLRVLSLSQSELLREAISEKAKLPLLRISFIDLLKAGLASNRGILMLSVAAGFYLQFSGSGINAGIERLFRFFPKIGSIQEGILWAAGLVMLGTLALRLLGVSWYILRFFGYQLDRHGDDLRISCGLLTKVTATVPRKRIQFISIHRPLFMRWMGLAAIRIETAGGSNDKRNAVESVAKRWFIPVLPESEVVRVMELLRPGLRWDESELNFAPLADRAPTRLKRIAIVATFLVLVIGLALNLTWGAIPALIAGPIFYWWAIKTAASMRYCRLNDGVIYRSGVLYKKISMTFFEKIQGLTLSQNPFDRRWGMARLSIDTAASGPADHKIAVLYLEEEFAREEFQCLRAMTGLKPPEFG